MHQITVTRTFAAAHAIYLPDGNLEPVHGHNWEITVAVAAVQLDEIETVMDFHQLEGELDRIIGPWHNGHLNEQRPFADQQGRLALNPTAERVAETIGRQIAETLPSRVHLRHVTVTEAPGCTATYLPG
jgi:6-pyruvoyltetrahydropterin/6-carboxytetrahydropterin synthase